MINIKAENFERVKELIEIARKNDIFNLTTREFREFEDEVYEACENKEKCEYCDDAYELRGMSNYFDFTDGSYCLMCGRKFD